jgi:hypothetical protein
MAALLLVFLTGSNSALFVQIGRTDPDFCFKVEKILPNLELRHQVHVFGTVQDQTTAPLEKSRIEMRRYISQRSQVSMRTVSTDEKGNFDLGIVKPGKYRLLASPHRGFKQPTPCNAKTGMSAN